MRRIVLLVMAGMLITGTVWAWYGDYPVVKTKTKVTAPKIKPGLKMAEIFEVVRVVNPEPVGLKDWTYKYGDKCRVDKGWTTEIVGTVKSGNLTLVMLRVSDRPDCEIAGCPTGVLFFRSALKVKKMLYREAKRKADEAAEKEAVKRLLEEGQPPKK